MRYPVMAAILGLIFTLGVTEQAEAAPPSDFSEAKQMARNYVYHDRADDGTFYCGCDWKWKGRTGGEVDLKSCGLNVVKYQSRAKRIEYEHILPISHVGFQRQCWKNGGRKNCNKTDPVFNKIEADLFNLTVAVGSINAERSNYQIGMVPESKSKQSYGKCNIHFDHDIRRIEPRDEVKGLVARTYFYMHDTYNMTMSRQLQQLLTAWDKQYPVTRWEMIRHNRIAAIMGHDNPYVTGQKVWGESMAITSQYNSQPQTRPASGVSSVSSSDAIRGNKNSKIYHLPRVCPSYDAMSPRNMIEFKTESEAVAQGYRKAKNCK